MRRNGRVLPDVGELSVVGQDEVLQDDVLHHRVEQEVHEANEAAKDRDEQQAWKKRTLLTSFPTYFFFEKSELFKNTSFYYRTKYTLQSANCAISKKVSNIATVIKKGNNTFFYT